MCVCACLQDAPKIRVIMRGKILQDLQSLSQCGIEDGTLVQAMLPRRRRHANALPRFPMGARERGRSSPVQNISGADEIFPARLPPSKNSLAHSLFSPLSLQWEWGCSPAECALTSTLTLPLFYSLFSMELGLLLDVDVDSPPRFFSMLRELLACRLLH